ncbi:nucleoside hydrolase-like domain-containing protein [Bremerella sp.]|uniref:nucleoside hydrolase-like domain-containing protein n=1 Tax=Bremerella sp. TaxID=2795602 RepID=UPI00391DBD2C
MLFSLALGHFASAGHAAESPNIVFCISDDECNVEVPRTKPKVWIVTDMSDKSLEGDNHVGTINDPDDISAMAGYLLMANEFETLGIVVASTHRSRHQKTPDQADWASRYFGGAYREAVGPLNMRIGGYPTTLSFMQSSIKETAEHFDPSGEYQQLDRLDTVKALLTAAQQLQDNEVLNVLCWGSVTEPAILVRHCQSTDKEALLRRLRFIAHWTNSTLHQGTPEDPEQVANCREDLEACRFLKKCAAQGKIQYYECGAIGQHGIVSGAPKQREYYDQFRVSRLGEIFVDGKFVRGCVDHSDAATYWTLLGDWGVSLSDIAPNGSNPTATEQANQKKYQESSRRIHDELLRRAKAAAKSN